MGIWSKIAQVGGVSLILLTLATPGIAATATKGDYDGDGKADIAVFRPSSGTWYIIPSSNPGSLIGDWFIIPSSTPTNFSVIQWGTNGDVPVQKPIGQ